MKSDSGLNLQVQTVVVSIILLDITYVIEYDISTALLQSEVLKNLVDIHGKTLETESTNGVYEPAAFHFWRTAVSNEGIRVKIAFQIRFQCYPLLY